jgi:hypothetical protein
MKEKDREKGRELWTFYPLIQLTQLVEVVLPNVFLKRLHLHHRSRSTRGVRAGALLGEAGAVLGEAGALPNRPIVFVVRFVLAHDKNNAHANGCERG